MLSPAGCQAAWSGEYLTSLQSPVLVKGGMEATLVLRQGPPHIHSIHIHFYLSIYATFIVYLFFIYLPQVTKDDSQYYVWHLALTVPSIWHFR